MAINNSRVSNVVFTSVLHVKKHDVFHKIVANTTPCNTNENAARHCTM